MTNTDIRNKDIIIKKINLHDESVTKSIGIKLYNSCSIGDIITLSGIIGSGKTTLARYFIKAGTNLDRIPSPTYNLIHSYTSNKGEICHFDAWRIKNSDEIIELGIPDKYTSVITLIEWPENVSDFIPSTQLNIKILFDGGMRIAYFRGGTKWEKFLNTELNDLIE